MPTTSPSRLRSGPPELPGIHRRIELDEVAKLHAGLAGNVLTAEPGDHPVGNGVDHAERIAHGDHLVPDVQGARSWPGLPASARRGPSAALSTARSFSGILVVTMASDSEPSEKVTLTCGASPTTWRQVRIMPGVRDDHPGSQRLGGLPAFLLLGLDDHDGLADVREGNRGIGGRRRSLLERSAYCLIDIPLGEPLRGGLQRIVKKDAHYHGQEVRADENERPVTVPNPEEPLPDQLPIRRRLLGERRLTCRGHVLSYSRRAAKEKLILRYAGG